MVKSVQYNGLEHILNRFHYFLTSIYHYDIYEETCRIIIILLSGFF
jgi:hypothetical protein